MNETLSIPAAMLLRLTAAARIAGELTQEERERLDDWIIENDQAKREEA